MARSILSLGIDCERALATASRSRALKAGSGTPSLAATVISRASFEKTLERAASDLPLRCMMFLACEWPAIRDSSVKTVGVRRPYSVAGRGNKGLAQAHAQRAIALEHDHVGVREVGATIRSHRAFDLLGGDPFARGGRFEHLARPHQ